jgi:hypothetical protein
MSVRSLPRLYLWNRNPIRTDNLDRRGERWLHNVGEHGYVHGRSKRVGGGCQ